MNNKAQAGTTYRGKQHFRSGYNIAAPRDGVPIDSNDAATDTINDNEESAIPNTDGEGPPSQYSICWSCLSI